MSIKAEYVAESIDEMIVICDPPSVRIPFGLPNQPTNLIRNRATDSPLASLAGSRTTNLEIQVENPSIATMM
jgi:hypothetical protein